MALFIVCLPLEALSGDEQDTAWNPSFMYLALGWIVVPFDKYSIPWLANPLLFYSWRCIGRNRLGTAFMLSIACSLLAFVYFSVGKIRNPFAGGIDSIPGFGIGFWLWFASMIAAAGACAILLWRKPVAEEL
ncbi:hypothetical protein [Pelagerythrobacter marensis]|uniref:hypothetical protein n=1 Tax=Pelagerythrobacter marensis TaxID=543877 RepID=UPI0013654559|nr:hypothetical protein [Pelagerythrobacter marensis]